MTRPAVTGPEVDRWAGKTSRALARPRTRPASETQKRRFRRFCSIYVVGHQALIGRIADFVEIYELDEGRRPRLLHDDFVAGLKAAVRGAAGFQ
jgi:hypothetical protein